MSELLKTNQNIEAAWSSIQRRSEDDPINGGLCKDRLTKAYKTKTPLRLFVPWGVRPTGFWGRSEEVALDWLKSVSDMFTKLEIPNQVMLMPADLYATEINKFPSDYVQDYFGRLAKAATQKSFDLIPWSKIRQDNRDRYDWLKEYVASPDILWRTFPKALWYRDLLPAAFRRNRSQNEREIINSAFAYLQERVVEAQMIDELYRPIKISLVSWEKDQPDGQLPRVYILPRPNRFPWLYDNQKGQLYEE